MHGFDPAEPDSKACWLTTHAVAQAPRQIHQIFEVMKTAADGPAAEVYRISPDEPWRVIRTRWRVAGQVSGPVEGGGRPSGYFTGATGLFEKPPHPGKFHALLLKV